MKANSPLISVILLAAGESKRMGEPKQLLPLGNSTIIEKTIDNYLNSSVMEVILVVGHRSKDLISVISDKPVKIELNPDYSQGMSTSIIAGINNMDAASQGIMIALADQPFIDSRTIDYLIEEFGNRGKGIVIPSYRGKRGHPVIFGSKYKRSLLNLKGDVGGREIINANPDDVAEIEVECFGITSDIDTKESYFLKQQNFGEDEG